MPREARKKSASGIYHVMLRGADRRVLFYDDEDNERFLDTLRHAKEISGFKLYAYCLMIVIGNSTVSNVSEFSPTPHRACKFPRTRRSIGVNSLLINDTIIFGSENDPLAELIFDHSSALAGQSAEGTP